MLDSRPPVGANTTLANLTPIEVGVLCALNLSRKRMTPGQLAGTMPVSRPKVVSALWRLQRDELVIGWDRQHYVISQAGIDLFGGAR